MRALLIASLLSILPAPAMALGSIPACSTNFSLAAPIEEALNHALGFEYLRHPLESMERDGLKLCATGLVLDKNNYQYNRTFLTIQARDAKGSLVASIPMLFQMASIQAHHNENRRPWIAMSWSAVNAQLQSLLPSKMDKAGPEALPAPTDPEFVRAAQGTAWGKSIDASSFAAIPAETFGGPRGLYLATWLERVGSPNGNLFTQLFSAKALWIQGQAGGTWRTASASGYSDLLNPFDRFLNETARRDSGESQDRINLLKSLSLPAEGGFYKKAAGIPSAPANLKKVLEGTVALGDNCSAVMLSEDGYAVTALHCITQCLHARWDYQPALEQKEIGRPGYYEGRSVKEQAPTRLACPEYIQREIRLLAYPSSEGPRIVWIGRGQHSHDQEKIAELTEAEFSQIAPLTEDVAVLKFERAGETKPFACLRLADSESPVGAPLWSVGFPSEAGRANGASSDGRNQFMSPGFVRASVEQDPVLAAQFASLTPAARELSWKREKALWNQPHLLLASVDAVGGNSGGAIINGQGELSGVLFTTMKTNHEAYNGSTVAGLKTQFLKQELTKSLGQKAAQAIFSCPR
jgi:hypothetical protein